MLSVSQCGYDNEYGKACRDRIDPVDLRTVREQAAHLTVKGGEYCGDWYGPMVCWPASGETSVPEYFSQVIRAVDEGQLEPEYTPVLPAIRAAPPAYRQAMA